MRFIGNAGLEEGSYAEGRSGQTPRRRQVACGTPTKRGNADQERENCMGIVNDLPLRVYSPQ
ncbi:MAG: hypothetical protein F6K39_45740, partial [Okeania sp. SIO3B3]|nr:hypothetical protein [Okeania sp. SIO3B3]